MQATRTAAVVLLCCGLGVVGASCVAGSEAQDEAALSVRPPGLEAQDDDGEGTLGGPSVDEGGGTSIVDPVTPPPDVGSVFAGGYYAPGGSTTSDDDNGAPTVAECVAAGRSVLARENFCRDRCPDENGKKRECWKRTQESLVQWIGWCNWNF